MKMREKMENGPVKIIVDGKPDSCRKGENLGEFLASRGYGEMPCGGHGMCGRCRVSVTGAVSPLSAEERRLLSEEEIRRGVRLACCTEVLGDCRAVTAARGQHAQIRADGELPPFLPDPAFSRYGAAVDIGTTTVAARLYDRNGTLLAETGCLNPQAVWGADVITRMEAALAGNAAKMAAAVRGAVDEALRVLASRAGIRAEEIGNAVLTGNTVMLYLLTGEETEPLTHAPFRAGRLFGETVPAGELALSAVCPSMPVYLPPCVAAFVGADTVTAVLASGMRNAPETGLLADIGTNGEMALWHRNRLRVCSAAAGPAFEGAGISSGMSGCAGAIDRVFTVSEPRPEAPGPLGFHVIGEGEAKGLCGSGLTDAVACLLETGQLDETGFLEEDPAVLAPAVRLTQKDIRMVQLAKSAIHAGMRTLLHTAGLPPREVGTLYIAGGFGSYLNVRNAGRIGLFPPELVPKTRVLGNAALTGAAMLLLSKGLRAECEVWAREAEVVELSSNPVFTEEYMKQMLF